MVKKAKDDFESKTKMYTNCYFSQVNMYSTFDEDNIQSAESKWVLVNKAFIQSLLVTNYTMHDGNNFSEYYKKGKIII